MCTPTCQEAECRHKRLLPALQQRLVPPNSRQPLRQALPPPLPQPSRRHNPITTTATTTVLLLLRCCHAPRCRGLAGCPSRLQGEVPQGWQQARLVVCQQQQRLAIFAGPPCAPHPVLVLRGVCQTDLQQQTQKQQKTQQQQWQETQQQQQQESDVW